MARGKHKIELTIRQWEDVAYEIDLDRIGRNPDWPMLEKYAPRVNMEAHAFRNWLLIWLAYGKNTAALPIIKKGNDHDKQGNSSEIRPVRELPTLKRRR